MDTLTHTVLGACLGETIAGRQLGKKAMLIGALANNFPDIDVVTSLWTNPANELLVHRGITHSILFACVATPLFSLGFRKFIRNPEMSFRRWLLLIGSGLFLHILMDAFTAYGTGWFEPFHHYRVSFNTLFILDPFILLCLLVTTIILLIMKRHSPKRSSIAATGLGIALIYLLVTIAIKLHVNHVITRNLAASHIPHQEYLATPTPLNNMLWYSVVKSNSDLYVGYYSVFDRSPAITWEYFERRDSLLGPLKNTEEVQLLMRFSKNYYCIRERDSILTFNDMRFGQIGGWYIPQAPFVFNFNLQRKEGNSLSLQQGRFKSFNPRDLSILVARIKGN